MLTRSILVVALVLSTLSLSFSVAEPSDEAKPDSVSLAKTVSDLTERLNRLEADIKSREDKIKAHEATIESQAAALKNVEAKLNNLHAQVAADHETNTGRIIEQKTRADAQELKLLDLSKTLGWIGEQLRTLDREKAPLKDVMKLWGRVTGDEERVKALTREYYRDYDFGAKLKKAVSYSFWGKNQMQVADPKELRELRRLPTWYALEKIQEYQTQLKHRYNSCPQTYPGEPPSMAQCLDFAVEDKDLAWKFASALFVFNDRLEVQGVTNSLVLHEFNKTLGFDTSAFTAEDLSKNVRPTFKYVGGVAYSPFEVARGMIRTPLQLNAFAE